MSSPIKFRWAVTAHTNTLYPAICLSTRHTSTCLVLSLYTFHKIHISAATYLVRNFTRAWPYTCSVAVRLHTFESSALDTGVCTGSHSRQFFSLRNNSRAATQWGRDTSRPFCLQPISLRFGLPPPLPLPLPSLLRHIFYVINLTFDSKQQKCETKRIEVNKGNAPHVLSSFCVLTMDTQQATARRHVESYSPNDVTLPPGGKLPLMPLLLNLLTTERLNYT